MTTFCVASWLPEFRAIVSKALFPIFAAKLVVTRGDIRPESGDIAVTLVVTFGQCVVTFAA